MTMNGKNLNIFLILSLLVLLTTPGTQASDLTWPVSSTANRAQEFKCEQALMSTEEGTDTSEAERILSRWPLHSLEKAKNGQHVFVRTYSRNGSGGVFGVVHRVPVLDGREVVVVLSENGNLHIFQNPTSREAYIPHSIDKTDLKFLNRFHSKKNGIDGGVDQTNSFLRGLLAEIPVEPIYNEQNKTPNSQENSESDKNFRKAIRWLAIATTNMFVVHGFDSSYRESLLEISSLFDHFSNFYCTMPATGAVFYIFKNMLSTAYPKNSEVAVKQALLFATSAGVGYNFFHEFAVMGTEDFPDAAFGSAGAAAWVASYIIYEKFKTWSQKNQSCRKA